MMRATIVMNPRHALPQLLERSLTTPAGQSASFSMTMPVKPKQQALFITIQARQAVLLAGYDSKPHVGLTFIAWLLKLDKQPAWSLTGLEVATSATRTICVLPMRDNMHKRRLQKELNRLRAKC
jgi:hypothetical protein